MTHRFLDSAALAMPRCRQTAFRPLRPLTAGLCTVVRPIAAGQTSSSDALHLHQSSRSIGCSGIAASTVFRAGMVFAKSVGPVGRPFLANVPTVFLRLVAAETRIFVDVIEGEESVRCQFFTLPWSSPRGPHYVRASSEWKSRPELCL